MVTEYPTFENISQKQKDYIDSVTKNFQPYADFAFSSLYIWRPHNLNTKISKLNNNLVIKAGNITTNRYDISIIGSTKIESSIYQLLKDMKELTLVPAEIITRPLINNKRILIEKEKDNYDYIYSTAELSNLSSRKFQVKRRNRNKFFSRYGNPETIRLDLYSKDQCTNIINLVISKWSTRSQQKGNKYNEDDEFDAIRRLISISHHPNIHILGFFIKKEPIGFATLDLENRYSAIASFGKYDPAYEGSGTMIIHLSSKYLYNLGYNYINLEQDLGCPNLKKAKISWNPIKYLKKYKLTIKSKDE